MSSIASTYYSELSILQSRIMLYIFSGYDSVVLRAADWAQGGAVCSELRQRRIELLPVWGAA